MLEVTFSPLIPTDNSEDFYKKFYYQYSFIQVNDILIRYLEDSITENDKLNLVNDLNNFNEDQNYATVCAIGAGIMNPALMRRNKENRGISTELFRDLTLKNINPLDWYEKVIEFLMVYAACEQAIKEYLVSNGVSSDSIKESTIINKLFTALQNKKIQDKFISEMSEGSSGVLKTQNELESVWHYYTYMRHTLTHAGGRTTEKARQNMANSIEKNKKEFKNISESMFIELDLSEDENFFNNPFMDDIVALSDKHMNFFRNMAILIVESLERIIHPNDYRIRDFDPYKL